jgi:type IV secretory pathway VirB6-like protein
MIIHLFLILIPFFYSQDAGVKAYNDCNFLVKMVRGVCFGFRAFPLKPTLSMFNKYNSTEDFVNNIIFDTNSEVREDFMSVLDIRSLGGWLMVVYFAVGILIVFWVIFEYITKRTMFWIGSCCIEMDH